MPALSVQIERHDARDGTVGAHLGLIGEHDALTRKCRRRGTSAFHGVHVEPIVGGENEIAADEAKPGVARGIDAAVVAMAVNAQPRRSLRQRLQTSDAVVGRAVVDHDDSDGGIVCREIAARASSIRCPWL
jgi:hypothetical protein